jgi:hypothetical protein
MVEWWCDRTGLSINLSKMVATPFTKNRDMKGLNVLTLFGNTIQLSREVKHLGLMLDKRPTWGAQLEKVINTKIGPFIPARKYFRTKDKSTLVNMLAARPISPMLPPCGGQGQNITLGRSNWANCRGWPTWL